MHEFWHAIFGTDYPVEVEIGPGTGTFIIPAAHSRPRTNFFAFEHSRSRATHLQQAINAHGLANALVVNADAGCAVATLIPAASVAAYHVYFPDPWWKRRHHRRRLFTAAFADALARTLMPGGRVHLATDVADVFALAAEVFTAAGAFAAVAASPSPRIGPTAFERKGLARGAAIREATFVRSAAATAQISFAHTPQWAPSRTSPGEGGSSHERSSQSTVER